MDVASDNSSSSTTLPTLLLKTATITFSWYDYVLFIIMLTTSALIGVYFGCFGSKQSTTNEYLMGNKKMRVFPISVSLVASHISGITLLAVPADIYRFGATYWLYVPASVVVCLLTMYLFLPVFHKLQVTSTYEYLERRFNKRNRLLASFLFTLGLFLYLPIVIYIPALAFSAATGINVHFITPVVCGVCIFYTTLGGLKAVVWTDTLQFIVTVGAVGTVFILGVNSTGGFGTIWQRSLDGHRLDVFDFDLDPTKRDSFWTITIGTVFGWLGMTGIHQSCVQKFMSVPTLGDAKRCLVYFLIGMVIVGSISVFTGLIMYARYFNCDPFTSGAINRADQLLPYYVMDVASHVPGLSGLFIAGVFCAALSTLSASLNCLAGTLFEDFFLNWRSGSNISEQTSALILRLLVVIIGVICTAMVYVVEQMGGLLPLAISLGGVTNGPLLGMFVLGVLFPKVSSKGSYWGSLIGLAVIIWVVAQAQYYKSIGVIQYDPKPTSVSDCYDLSQNMTEDFTSFFNSTQNSAKAAQTDEIEHHTFFLFRISHFYYTPLATMITIISGLIISVFFKNDDPPVHPDLLSPFIQKWLNLEEPKKRQDKHLNYYNVETALKLVTKEDEIKQ